MNKEKHPQSHDYISLIYITINTFKIYSIFEINRRKFKYIQVGKVISQFFQKYIEIFLRLTQSLYLKNENNKHSVKKKKLRNNKS